MFWSSLTSDLEREVVAGGLDRDPDGAGLRVVRRRGRGRARTRRTRPSARDRHHHRRSRRASAGSASVTSRDAGDVLAVDRERSVARLELAVGRPALLDRGDAHLGRERDLRARRGPRRSALSCEEAICAADCSRTLCWVSFVAVQRVVGIDGPVRVEPGEHHGRDGHLLAGSARDHRGQPERALVAVGLVPLDGDDVLLVEVAEHVHRRPGRERHVGHRLARGHDRQPDHQDHRKQRRPGTAAHAVPGSRGRGSWRHPLIRGQARAPCASQRRAALRQCGGVVGVGTRLDRLLRGAYGDAGAPLAHRPRRAHLAGHLARQVAHDRGREPLLRGLGPVGTRRTGTAEPAHPRPSRPRSRPRAAATTTGSPRDP